MRTIAKLYLVAATLCCLILTTTAVADTGSEARIADQQVGTSQHYAFPNQSGNKSLGTTGGPGRGVGLKIGDTWWDQQQIGSMGRMIDYGSDPSDPTQFLMQFSWTYAPPGDPTLLSQRTYRFQVWDAGYGGLMFPGGTDVHNPVDEYGGYVGIDITDDNQALIGGHLRPLPSGDYNSTFYRDFFAGIGFFADVDSIPNALANYCAVTQDSPYDDGACWPKFRLVESGGNTLLHVIALEGEPAPGDPATLVYYRLNGPVGGPSSTWDIPPLCLDTVYVVGHDIAADDYGHVALTWIAQKHDVNDPCGGQDICSGLGGSDPLVDNDVYYQLSVDHGANWNPRQNITKNYTGTRPYRPYTDLSAFYDSKSDFHVAWGSREWDDTGPPYKLSGRIFHWSEDNPLIRSVHPFLWSQPNCNGGYWMLNASKMTLSECDGKLYCLFVQFNDVPHGIDDDCAAPGSPGYPDGAANGDLFVCVSGDYGLTWDYARNLTNTYTPGCDSVDGEGGLCANENWPSMTKFGTDFAGNFSGVPIVDPSASYIDDWFLDVQYMMDYSAGAYTNGLWPNPGWKSGDRTGPPGQPFQEGYFREVDVEWFRLACVEPVVSPIIVLRPDTMTGPIWIPHGIQFDTVLTIENTGNATLSYAIAIEEDSGPVGWLGTSGFSGSVPSGASNTETGTVNINLGGIVNTPGIQVDLIGRLIFNSNADTAPDTIPVHASIIDTIYIPKLNGTLGPKGSIISPMVPGVLMIKGQQYELWTSVRKAKSRLDKYWNHHVLLNDPNGYLSGISHKSPIVVSGSYTAVALPPTGMFVGERLIAEITVGGVDGRGSAPPVAPSAPSGNRPPRPANRVADPCKFAILVTGYCDDDFVNDINQKYDYKTNYNDVDPDNVIVLGPEDCLDDFDAPAGTMVGGEIVEGGAYPATEENVQKAFAYIKAKMLASGCTETEFQFHSSSHGGGNHTAPGQVPAGEEPAGGGGQGWSGGQVDPPGGDEANRISEDDLRFGGGQGVIDVDGDGEGDILSLFGPPARVYHDADGDGVFEDDELVGTDTNGDGYVDNLDDDWTAPDMDRSGGVTEIGVDDLISLGEGGVLVDDDLMELICDLVANTPLTIEECRAEMDQCFSGSFIDDLEDCVGEHATACAAGEYSYGNGEEGADAHGEFEYPFIEALKNGATWEEAFNEAVDTVNANEVPETPQYNNSTGGGDCCLDRGNVDDIIGTAGPIDVSDLTYLVGYLFLGGPPPPCIEQGNVDGITGSGGPIDVSDLTYLVAFLFTGGSAPPPC